MASPTLDQLLAEKRDAPPIDLPTDFASVVLSRATRLRAAMRRHWRLLTFASLAAIALSVGIGLSRVHAETTSAPIPLQLFQSPSESAPFSTR